MDDAPDAREADPDWFDPAATTFGDRLTGAREAAGLGVEDLARRLGVKPKTIRAWEEDRSEPRANRVSMLAGVTNVSLVWLMTGTGRGPGADRAGAGQDELAREVGRLREDCTRMADRLRRLELRLRSEPPDD